MNANNQPFTRTNTTAAAPVQATAVNHATDLHAHAKALGSLPKELFNGRRMKRRKWTGFIGRQRMRVDQEVILPNGETGFIKQVASHCAIVRTIRNNPDGTKMHVYIPVECLRVPKNPDAAALGTCKRGVQERKSELKAATARVNGKTPPGHGKRRGRPSKETMQRKPALPVNESARMIRIRLSMLQEALESLGFDDEEMKPWLDEFLATRKTT